MSTDDQRIFDRIRAAITAGELAPATKLAEEPLAAAFAVSRVRIRETLRKLNFAGLVDLIPNRGAFVARPTRENAVAIYAARRLIEEEVARLAASNADKQQIRRFRAHIKEEHAARVAGDRAAFVRLIGEFHVRLAEAAGNPVLVGFVEQLLAQTSLIIQLYERPGPSGCSTDEHSAIVDMIERGDGDGAAETMSAHLSAIENRLSFEEAERPPVDFKALFGSPSPRRRKPSRIEPVSRT